MNTYQKLIPNVFLAKCSDQHNRGDIIEMTTRHGDQHDCVVHNLIKQENGYYCYSVTRDDGYNVQKRAQKKAEKYAGHADNALKKSDRYYDKSNENADFLSLGEPIKIGHHSEKRHRKIIEQANNNMSKSVEFVKKADEYKDKADDWARKTGTINLSMPESLVYFTKKLEAAKQYHAGLKSGKFEKAHDYSLTYAKKEVNELAKKLEWSHKLWG